MTTNDAKYYESSTATASDAQGDITHNAETVTQTSNGNDTVACTSNGNFENKLLSKRTIPVVVPTMNPRIDQRIATIVAKSFTASTSPSDLSSFSLVKIAFAFSPCVLDV